MKHHFVISPNRVRSRRAGNAEAEKNQGDPVRHFFSFAIRFTLFPSRCKTPPGAEKSQGGNAEIVYVGSHFHPARLEKKADAEQSIQNNNQEEAAADCRVVPHPDRQAK